MIHLYAFAQGLRSLPPCAGVADEPLDVRAVDDVTAVVGVVGAMDGDRAEQALAHGLVVESLLERGDSVLPVRFGERFDDDRALLDAAEPRLPELRRQLAHLQGAVEVAVRVLGTSGEGDAPVPADGGAYMRGKLARHALADELHASLAEFARDVRVAQLTTGRVLLDAAYLVRRADVERCVEHVERFAALHPELTTLCTGPWAPYSFAEIA